MVSQAIDETSAPSLNAVLTGRLRFNNHGNNPWETKTELIGDALSMAARYPRSLDSIVTFIQGDRIRRCPSDERQMKCTPFAKLSAFSIQDRHFIRRSPWNLEYAPRCLQIYFEGKIRLSKKRPAFSPLFTAKATFALKAVAWRRRGRLLNHLSASAKLAALRPRFHFTDVPIAQSQS
jgi:hypothetical protein